MKVIRLLIWCSHIATQDYTASVLLINYEINHLWTEDTFVDQLFTTNRLDEFRPMAVNICYSWSRN